MGDDHATHRRVKFDFEVDFSNGGGLQGQEFRLDIETEDISEEQLARYIVEDMRLLMVEEVRILNKEIIAEGRRSSPRATSGSSLPLSHRLGGSLGFLPPTSGKLLKAKFAEYLFYALG
jgi:hypothetical protein